MKKSKKKHFFSKKLQKSAKIGRKRSKSSKNLKIAKKHISDQKFLILKINFIFSCFNPLTPTSRFCKKISKSSQFLWFYEWNQPSYCLNINIQNFIKHPISKKVRVLPYFFGQFWPYFWANSNDEFWAFMKFGKYIVWQKFSNFSKNWSFGMDFAPKWSEKCQDSYQVLFNT